MLRIKKGTGCTHMSRKAEPALWLYTRQVDNQENSIRLKYWEKGSITHLQLKVRSWRHVKIYRTPLLTPRPGIPRGVSSIGEINPMNWRHEKKFKQVIRFSPSNSIWHDTNTHSHTTRTHTPIRLPVVGLQSPVKS